MHAILILNARELNLASCIHITITLFIHAISSWLSFVFAKKVLIFLSFIVSLTFSQSATKRLDSGIGGKTHKKSKTYQALFTRLCAIQEIVIVVQFHAFFNAIEIVLEKVGLQIELT